MESPPENTSFYVDPKSILFPYPCSVCGKVIAKEQAKRAQNSCAFIIEKVANTTFVAVVVSCISYTCMPVYILEHTNTNIKINVNGEAKND